MNLSPCPALVVSLHRDLCRPPGNEPVTLWGLHSRAGLVLATVGGNGAPGESRDPHWGIALLVGEAAMRYTFARFTFRAVE